MKQLVLAAGAALVLVGCGVKSNADEESLRLAVQTNLEMIERQAGATYASAPELGDTGTMDSVMRELSPSGPATFERAGDNSISVTGSLGAVTCTGEVTLNMGMATVVDATCTEAP